MAECTLSSSDIKKNDSSLINQYVTGESAYFSSPTNAILAHPPFANLLDVGIKNLSQQVVESLRFATELGHSDPIVIGAIPFDTSKPSALRLSTGFSFEKETSAFNHTVASTYQATDIGKVSIKTVPSSNEFVGAVFNALERFSRKELDKVVLSRTLQLDSEHDVDIASVLKRLKNGNANGYTFAVPANQHEHKLCKKTLLGASPELLIKKIGNKIIANPLAGSEPKQGDIKADKLITDQLMNSKKDRYEHALVIKSIAQALKPLCKSINIPKEPSLIATETMWHLSTKIEGELKSSNITSLDVAMAMHPTPAIGGFPTKAAITAIDEIETYDRKLFTGMVGWCDLSGDGEWVVTIRCAEIENNKATLYAGAGIVEGSIPEKELAETGAKFNTMLNALGIDVKGQDIE